MIQATKLHLHQKLNEDGEVEQQCIKCQEWWHADSEFFNKNPQTKSGLSPYCKACSSEYRRVKYQEVKRNERDET